MRYLRNRFKLATATNPANGRHFRYGRTYLRARDACATRIIELAHPGDRIVIMGARDDTLALFAGDLLAAFA